MSHHEWNDVMYGIRLPQQNPSNEKILAFMDNHRESIYWFRDENYYPVDESNIDEFLFDYEDDMGNTGISVLIAEVIGNMFIVNTYDQYGDEYIGMYAATLFPWQSNRMSDMWKSMTPEYIESLVKPVVEELYGTCPKFEEHVIWNNG